MEAYVRLNPSVLQLMNLEKEVKQAGSKVAQKHREEVQIRALRRGN